VAPGTAFKMGMDYTIPMGPPSFPLLGSDALTNYRRVADARAAEIDKWEELTTSTDFDS
jgi:hypothetical protein